MCGLVHFRHSFDHVGSPSPTTSSPPPMAQIEFSNLPPSHSTHLIKPQAEKLRRISTGSMDIEVTSEKQTHLHSTGSGFIKCTYHVTTLCHCHQFTRPCHIGLSQLQLRMCHLSSFSFDSNDDIGCTR